MKQSWMRWELFGESRSQPTVCSSASQGEEWLRSAKRGGEKKSVIYHKRERNRQKMPLSVQLESSDFLYGEIFWSCVGVRH